jgi:fructose-1,6-bisphosphatase/inositol monophosphatase family enzyme
VTLFSHADLQALAGILELAAGNEVMPRFRKLGVGDIRSKDGPLDLVTEADEAAEREITAALRKRFPGCVVVGEEAASADPEILGSLAAADLAFVVDPVDGTSNFAWGMPLFATMAAVLVGGEIVGSVIHDPVGQDSAMALRGEGAWTQTTAGRSVDLRVAAAVPASQMAGGCSWRYLPKRQGARIAARLPNVAASFGYRCAGHEYRLLAGGHCHYLLYGRTLPWDHAPGWLLHREAGGYAARFDGSPYRARHLNGGLVCVPDVESWHSLREALHWSEQQSDI